MTIPEETPEHEALLAKRSSVPGQLKTAKWFWACSSFAYVLVVGVLGTSGSPAPSYLANFYAVAVLGFGGYFATRIWILRGGPAKDETNH